MSSAAGRAATPGTTTSAAAAASAHATGTRKVRRAPAGVTRRQATSGPIPDSRTSTIASGTV